ncbi:sigma-70 family RNA polymerase sigma factor [Paenibacillus luteus]|uniref:sigma-70 family RNA polymerase sigma factor n=1 Tax=Paenibacillus luteus TaxID=2545753 RepID=UPI0011416D88|nr:sigma-70 family RNA polymerase sigma factor [Paenibacillus luteus]
MPYETTHSNDDLTALVHRHADLMMRVAYTYLKNTADAQDVCQDVFIKLAKRSVVFSQAEHEKAWVIRVTINVCKDLLRSPWKKLFSPISESVRSIQNTSNQEVVACVLDLPAKYRIVIYLYYYEGYSTAEIAGLLKRNENTVRTQLKRARELLKACMIGGFVNE